MLACFTHECTSTCKTRFCDWCGSSFVTHRSVSICKTAAAARITPRCLTHRSISVCKTKIGAVRVKDLVTHTSACTCNTALARPSQQRSAGGQLLTYRREAAVPIAQHLGVYVPKLRLQSKLSTAQIIMLAHKPNLDREVPDPAWHKARQTKAQDRYRDRKKNGFCG